MLESSSASITAEGIYDINNVCDTDRPFHSDKPSMTASCSFESDGGWLVILKRDVNFTEHINFNRPWADYKLGFGDLETEFWYGLDNIHCLTTREPVDLKIVLKQNDGTEMVWTYGQFVVDGEHSKYTLHIGEAQGPDGIQDGMAYHNGMEFTTSDNDNDRYISNCASLLEGGWWFNSCFRAFLTGPHTGGVHVNARILWYYPTVTQLHFVEMKVRPKRCVHQSEVCGDSQ